MKKVIIYSTPYCVYCKKAKEFFSANNVNFEEFNVAENMQAQQEMIRKTGQLAVPVIDIAGEVFVGFDKKGIAQALSIAV